MSSTEPASDPWAADFALHASDLLAQFNRAGVLHAADVHVGQRLALLAGEEDEEVALAVALAVRAPRVGHVHVDLERIAETAAFDLEELREPEELPWPHPEAWIAKVRKSPLIADRDKESELPVRVWDSRLYLDRYWREERQIADDLLAMARGEPSPYDEAAASARLAGLFPEGTEGKQPLAAAAALAGRLTVIAGGPGTGKTTTVARIVALLLSEAAERGDHFPLIALAAPTGKASQRLGEAVRDAAPDLDVADDVRERLEAIDALTLHRLLGWRPGSHSRFRHDRSNHLPHEVVVIDETSMVSLWMMGRLLEAIRPDARLILVGDPDQLASVEAGAVLGDVVRSAGGAPSMDAETAERLSRLTGVTAESRRPDSPAQGLGNRIVTLDRIYRFEGAIGDLAAAVRSGDPDKVLGLLETAPQGIEWIDMDAADAEGGDALEPVRQRVVQVGRAIFDAAEAGDAKAALKALGRHRVLCAHRRGFHGVSGWNSRVERWISQANESYHPYGRWYLGRPLLVTENSYELKLFNGDTGVIVRRDPGEDKAAAAFDRSEGPALFSPAQIDAVETVHAMTIHKSQGSQFQAVTLVLPPPESRILTRELLYTAVTRSQTQLTVVGGREAIERGVQRQVMRASGLTERLGVG